MKIQFEILGKPMGKQRPRLGKFGTYTPDKTINYENLVKLTFMNKYKNFTPIEKPIKATIKAYFTIPQSYTQKKKRELLMQTSYTHKPDSDNIAKIVLDSLNTIAYKDDSQISKLIVSKEYAVQDKVIVEIEELEANT